MSRIFAYGRASTGMQQITLDSQKHLCEKYIDYRISVDDSLSYAGWHPDPAVSTKLPWFERPSGEKLLVETVPEDTIVVSNFDRAFRSVIDCHKSLEIVHAKGVHLVILDVDVNTKTPLGKAFMKIIAVIKELERDEIGRRTSEALLRMRAQGMPVSPKTTEIGWRFAGKRVRGVARKRIPDETARRWAWEIVRLHDEDGLTFEQIRKKLLDKKARSVHGEPLTLAFVGLSYSAALIGFPKCAMRHVPLPNSLGCKRARVLPSHVLHSEKMVAWRSFLIKKALASIPVEYSH